MGEECSHSCVEISVAYPADPIFVCEKCQHIIPGSGCIAVTKRIQPKTKGATYLFKKMVTKEFEDTRSMTRAAYYVDYLWNPATGKIFTKYRCRQKIFYNKITNKLYRLYRVAKKRGWRIRDISYAGAWFHHSLGYDPFWVASRGNPGVANILQLAKKTHMMSDDLAELARSLRGGKNLSVFKLTEEHWHKILHSDNDEAQFIVSMAVKGWSSIGINAALKGLDQNVLGGGQWKQGYYRLSAMRSKLSGSEAQLAAAMVNKQLDNILDALGNRTSKIPYSRLSKNLRGLKIFLDKHRHEYGNEELMEIMANSLKRDFKVKRESHGNIIRIEHGKYLYAIVPRVPTVKVIRDTGTHIEIDIHEPTSIDRIIRFIKGGR